MEILKTLDKFKIDIPLPILACENYLKAKTNYKYGWFKTNTFLLPFIIEKKGVFTRIIFTHSCISLNDNNNNDSEKVFLEHVIVASKELDVDLIYTPLVTSLFNTFPSKAKYCSFGTYQIDLLEPEEVLLANMHQKHRNVIKKANSEKVEIFEGKEYLSICANLIKETMLRQNMPFTSEAHLKKMHDGIGENISFFVASYKGVFQGSAAIVWQKGGTAYYFHGGSIRQPFTGSLNLMHWEIIKQMKERGVKIYDFVGARIAPEKGSKLEGIQRFKLRFGAQMKVGYLWKYPLKPLKYFLYIKTVQLNSLIRYRKKHPGDLIDQENRNEQKGHTNI